MQLAKLLLFQNCDTQYVKDLTEKKRVKINNKIDHLNSRDITLLRNRYTYSLLIH